MLLALLHRRKTGHRIWREEMIWSGERAMVWFCECQKQWHPLSQPGPYPDGRDPIHREPPWEREK
jgi:hypothetical protein